MLTGKSIIVTGSNRGIGKTIVEECAKNHADVWACMRQVTDENVLSMEELSKKYNVTIKAIELDLLDKDSIKNSATEILSEKLQIDGIVNNAGATGPNRLFSMTSMEDIRETFEVNFFGPILFLQRFLKKMMRWRTGSIVNIASIAAIDGEPAQLEYVSSKAAMIGATRKLASELGQFGIRVNAVAPGMTDTDMVREMDTGLMEKTLDRTMMHRLAKAEEIAKAVVFLLSDQSAFITGQTIRVDGGAM